jgi:capsid portal protein
VIEINFCCSLIHIGLKSSINERNFPNCHEILAKLSKIIKESNLFNKRPSNESSSTPKQHQDEIKEILESDTGVFILKELKDDFKVERERLWYELDREWDTLVRVDINETNLVASSLKISKKIDQLKLDQLSQFSSLKLSQFNFDNRQVSFVFYNKLKQFSAQFLQLCLQAVINNSQLFEIRIDETDAEFHSIYFSNSVTLSS